MVPRQRVLDLPGRLGRVPYRRPPECRAAHVGERLPAQRRDVAELTVAARPARGWPHRTPAIPHPARQRRGAVLDHRVTRSRHMLEPIADRPHLPDGYLGGAPLPWAWAEQRLLEARNYWICTVSPHGRPRARPVWGLWLDDAVVFSTGALIGRDVRHQPNITVHLDAGDEGVIIEGTATITDDEATRQAFVDA